MARRFSRFHAPRQELSDFLTKTKGLKVRMPLQTPEDHFPSIRYNPTTFTKNPVDLLALRQQRKDLMDFDTSSSDHDAKYFSASRYLSDSIFLARISKFGILLNLIAATVAYWVGVYLSKPVFSVLRSVTFLGHWRLMEPAFYDMQRARYKQRIKFAVLRAYD